MSLCGVPVDRINICVAGAEIRGRHTGAGKTAMTAVYLAGPLVNLISGAVSAAAGWDIFALCSFALAAVNLLPVRTLDGGNALSVLLSDFSWGRVLSLSCPLSLCFFSGSFRSVCCSCLTVICLCWRSSSAFSPSCISRKKGPPHLQMCEGPFQMIMKASDHITLYSLSSFSISVCSIFSSTTLSASFWTSGRSMSVIFFPSRSFTVAFSRSRTS